jgi:hypothetical protein
MEKQMLLACPTEKKLVSAIKSLADKIDKDVSADDALKFTQAALNAANTIRTMTVK